MVVLSPLFEGEKTKVCPQCGTLGIVSPDRERSSFYAHSRKRSLYRRTCRRCYSGEKSRRQSAKRDRTVSTAPKMPAQLADMTEDQRIDWHLRRERRGIPLPLPSLGCYPEYRGRPSRYVLPVGPVRDWIEGLIERQKMLMNKTPGDHVPVEGAICDRLRITERHLWRWRYECVTIDERWVDWITTQEGSIRPEDLYPELECDG